MKVFKKLPGYVTQFDDNVFTSMNCVFVKQKGFYLRYNISELKVLSNKLKEFHETIQRAEESTVQE